MIPSTFDVSDEGRFKAVALVALMVSMALAGCAGSGGQNQATLQQAGSSTVFPIAEAWAEQLARDGIQVVVAGGGSGAGVSKLCAGEVDIGDMSREMKPSEIEDCQANGIEPQVWEVAFDGITVTVHPDNDWVDHLTVEELAQIWRPDDPAQTWADVREGWPDEPIRLFGPDSESGTYEYFNEVILDEEAPRQDYQSSTDDNVLVEGVSQSKYALAYFGFAYFDENRERLQSVGIKDGDGEPVQPSLETIGDGSYTPLSRPLYMVTDGKPAAGSPLHSYFEYALGEGQDIVPDVGYVSLDQETIEEQRTWL